MKPAASMSASAIGLVILAAGIVSTIMARESAADADCSTGGRTQTEINLCAAAEADKAKSSLSRLLAALEVKLSASEWKGLRSVQDDWRRFAEHQCEWEASLSEGGSMAPATRAFCTRTLTRQRIEVLKGFLCEGAGMTGPCEESRRF
jgi:uncharacterized protein YecT (DUF1311 family)